MKDSPFNFTIGQKQWEQQIRYFTAEMALDYWADFHPVTVVDLTRIESDVGRQLPADLKEFLRVFGAGNFPRKFGGVIYNPSEMMLACHMHLAMILGSLGTSAWASEEDQKHFYVTRGQFNPAPDKYTEEALRLEDVSLLDLLQIGTNGLGGYHQVYVGERPGTLGYCYLLPEGTIEDRAPSFSEGLRMILTHHWQWGDPPEEIGGGEFVFEEE